MALLTADAIVLHVFDYLESSRIVRLVTRDAGMRSAIAKGARSSRRRFGSGLDLFAQGTAHLHTKPGRELDILSAFEDVRTRTALGADLDRFTGAAVLAEIALAFGRDGADEQLFDTLAGALDRLATVAGSDARVATIAGAWQLVTALGFGPAVEECAECGAPIDGSVPALFSHAAGGTLCARDAAISGAGRALPGAARAAIAGWMTGAGGQPALTEADVRAHQRLLREFLVYHLHDGRALRVFDLWESPGYMGGSEQRPEGAPAA